MAKVHAQDKDRTRCGRAVTASTVTSDDPLKVDCARCIKALESEGMGWRLDRAQAASSAREAEGVDERPAYFIPSGESKGTPRGGDAHPASEREARERGYVVCYSSHPWRMLPHGYPSEAVDRINARHLGVA